jgi:hypothetical protein
VMVKGNEREGGGVIQIILTTPSQCPSFAQENDYHLQGVPPGV